MSNHLAIAAATKVLHVLLQKKVASVTALSLDKANSGSGQRINLFLYHTQVDGAWRNQDLPGKAKPGETGRPPLPLSLFYLLTAYGKDEEESHQVLGQAMTLLHDHPVLGPAEIKNVLPESEPQPIESLRLTLHPLSVEEAYKLWTVFQAPYRISVAYQVAVVLLESARPAKAPLPVLRRGEDDRGVASQTDLIPPFPALTELVLPGKQASALLGDTVILRGHHLDQGTLGVRFTNPHLTAAVPFTVGTKTATEVSIKLDGPQAAKKWVAGFYTVALILKDGDRERATNELPLTIAPQILSSPASVIRGPLPDQKAEITVTFSPEVRPAQRAALLWGDLEVPALAHPAQKNTLKFEILKAQLGKRFLRLRIDGVDSFLIDPNAKPPAFDPAKMLEIT